jgi:hypothetical protein
VLAEVGAVAFAGFRTLDTGGRVGGLLSPPVAFVLVDAVALVADEDVARGRLGATPGRFGGTFSFLTPFDSAIGSFSASVTSASDVCAVRSSAETMSVGVSSWRGA